MEIIVDKAEEIYLAERLPKINKVGIGRDIAVAPLCDEGVGFHVLVFVLRIVGVSLGGEPLLNYRKLLLGVAMPRVTFSRKAGRTGLNSTVYPVCKVFVPGSL
ncbi:MAG: hypothetical protein OXE94_06860 [Aestuariivita sp.]|nr:hypothetical protein [Aestuariivita sp.]